MLLSNLKAKCHAEKIELKLYKGLSNSSFSYYEAEINNTRMRFLVDNVLEKVIRFTNVVHYKGMIGISRPRSFKQALLWAKVKL